MSTFKDEIEIEAPIKDVWQHLTDVERWHEWNPFQQQATGDGLQVQSVMHFKLVQISKGWTSSSREQVSAVEAPTNDENGEGGGQRARWVYKYTGLLAAIGGVSSVRETVLIASQNGRTTRVIGTSEFSGWLSCFLPLKHIRAGFNRMMLGLKTRSEGGGQGR